MARLVTLFTGQLADLTLEKLAEKEDTPPAGPEHAPHPVQLLARAYRGGED